MLPALTAFAVLLAVGLSGCAETDDAWLGNLPDQAGFTPSGDASTNDSADGSSSQMCAATECPNSRTTCPSEYGPTYTCAVDLLHDSKNCGACGNECRRMDPLHMDSRCVEGRCELECMSLPRFFPPEFWYPTEFVNCNALLDDGCEIDVLSDARNCGSCGNVCPDGQACAFGRCGCPNGLTNCNGVCIDVSSNDANCHECGKLCDSTGECEAPPNSSFGCVSNDCGGLKCLPKFGDCDVDLSKRCDSNGCETSFLDHDHCGACDVVCGPDETCREEAEVIACRPTCDRLGKVECGDGACADLQTDPENCGGCNLLCPMAAPGQRSVCRKGICVVECVEGLGDCNGDPADGCEADLSAHPSHCGACGNACDLDLGQPCVEGKCLVRPCDGPVAK